MYEYEIGDQTVWNTYKKQRDLKFAGTSDNTKEMCNRKIE